MSTGDLRRGDLVEVRPAAEILATLDFEGCLEGVPFMPEMLGHVGRRFMVEARVERACDTITQKGARRMPETVLLDDLRCDGSAHGGCQAGCRLYWKEAWLQRVSADEPRAPSEPDNGLERRAHASTRASWRRRARAVPLPGDRAPALDRADRLVGPSLLRSRGRVRERRSLAFRPRHRAGGARGGAPAASPLPGPARRAARRGLGLAPRTGLNLGPGELVRVRSKEEIAQTLGANGKTRGLWFDPGDAPLLLARRIP